jgi:hypothetical protein
MKRNLSFLAVVAFSLAVTFTFTGCTASLGPNGFVVQALPVVEAPPPVVVEGPPPPIDEVAMDEQGPQPPLEYGVEMYTPLPVGVVLAFPYDPGIDRWHWRQNGEFVDVVVVRRGVEHVVEWRDHGVRMTPKLYETWRLRSENKIPRKEIERQMAMEEKRGVKHPPEYYGLKPTAARGPNGGSNQGYGSQEHRGQPGVQPNQSGQHPGQPTAVNRPGSAQGQNGMTGQNPQPGQRSVGSKQPSQNTQIQGRSQPQGKSSGQPTTRSQSASKPAPKKNEKDKDKK